MVFYCCILYFVLRITFFVLIDEPKRFQMSIKLPPPMFRANYHTHSFFCDGHESPEMYVKKAIDLEMNILGISSHAPVSFTTDWNMDSSQLPDYLELLSSLKNKYKDQIQLLTSLEVDYIPGTTGPDHENIHSANLDYIIGSVHFVDAYPNDVPFSIDDSTEDFKKGIDEIFDGDVRNLVKRYFELQRKMLENEPPHILGHMDKIRMHNRNHFFFNESADWYLKEVRDTMKLAAEKGVVVEINTKYFEPAGLSFPSSDHFKWMAKNHIPLTLNSDAHQPENLLSGFKDIIPRLKESGIYELWHYTEGIFSPRKYQ